MLESIPPPVIAAAAATEQRRLATGEPVSFVLSFGVILLVLLLDCVFRRLGD